MGIKCGNCKGKHDTIQEVKNCYGAEFVYASDKQVAFLKTLLAERMPINDVDVDNLSRTEASTWISKLKEMPRTRNIPSNGAFGSLIAGSVPKPGTYTVVRENGYRTLKIRKPHPQADWVGVEFMSGPDNSHDFIRFGKVVPEGVQLWAKFSEDTELAESLRYLLNLSDKMLKAAGFKYALESGNCYICGRKLTVPASIHQGMGPVCAGKE